MRVAFRVDASTSLGSGHVMRCLALASYLESRGAECVFVCRRLPGNLIDYLRSMGQVVIDFGDEGDMQEDVFVAMDDAVNMISVIDEAKTDIVIVDHYSIAENWEHEVSKHCRKMVAIDDLADRKHSVDILLDQNLFPHARERYRSKVPESCQLLLGPQYALLRREFIDLDRTAFPSRGPLRRILVFYGGADTVNETAKALTALDYPDFNGILVDIVLGEQNPHREELITRYAGRAGWRFHVQTESMAGLMMDADLMVCAGGTIQWERIYMGLPGIVTAVAENQRLVCETLAANSLAIYLGFYDGVNVESIRSAVLAWKECGEQAWQKVSGQLLTVPIANMGRVADIILA